MGSISLGQEWTKGAPVGAGKVICISTLVHASEMYMGHFLQFPLGHARGSSHGHSRGIRKAYPEKYYAEMMNDAYQQWLQLQAECGEMLYKLAITLLGTILDANSSATISQEDRAVTIWFEG